MYDLLYIALIVLFIIGFGNFILLGLIGIFLKKIWIKIDKMIDRDNF
jgi:hypothetical protein